MALGLHLPPEEVAAAFDRRLDYHTPLAVADAAVFDASGRILLMRRHDNEALGHAGRRLRGGGDRGRRGHARVVRGSRRARRGAGAARRLGLAAAQDSRSPFHLYHHVFLCRIVSGAPATSAEATAVGYFAPDALPELSPGHTVRVPAACDLYRQWAATGYCTPYFDR